MDNFILTVKPESDDELEIVECIIEAFYMCHMGILYNPHYKDLGGFDVIPHIIYLCFPAAAYPIVQIIENWIHKIYIPYVPYLTLNMPNCVFAEGHITRNICYGKEAFRANNKVPKLTRAEYLTFFTNMLSKITASEKN